MLDRLRQGFRQVMGQAAVEPEGPRQLESIEARLLIRQDEGTVAFQPTFSNEPMLRLRGHLSGPLSTGRLAGRSSTTLLRLQLPVTVDGRDSLVDITVMRAGHTDGSDGFTLARARRRRVPPSDQAVELLYANAHDGQVRYLVQMDAAIKPLGFREFSRHESVFKDVPSVSQMVAFLRATLHTRRTTLRSLTSMARNASAPHVHQVVEEMNRRLSQGQDFATDDVRHAVTRLNELGHATNPNTLAALALLADIFLENIRSEHLDALVEQGAALPISQTALNATMAFLGARPDADERALAFLRSTVARRNALSILTDLADDSGSERSRNRVDQLLTRVGREQPLLNDEHVALQAYLERRGRKIQADTISALAIYVDFEAGILNEEDVDGLTPHRAFVDASLYSMLAIARAFEFELRCWLLPNVRSDDAVEQDLMWLDLENLVALSDGGVIARFLEPGAPGHQTMHVQYRSDIVEFRKRGYLFTGELLADLPTIHHLVETELPAFEAVGLPVIGRFVSEGGLVQWRRLEVQPPRSSLRKLLKRPYSFIDRYEIFHFGQAVLGSRARAEAEQLVGAENVLLIYRDARGAHHYKHVPHVSRLEEVTVAPQRDWEWDRAVVRFAESGLFPRVLTEASHEYLLGLPDDRASLDRLDLVYEGLEDCLEAAPQMLQLKDAPEAHERLREVLQSQALRALLVGIFEVGARDEAVVRLQTRSDGLWVTDALCDGLEIPALVEVAALIVLATLCGDSVPFDRARFDDLLLDRLLAAAESEDPEVRRRAVEMMGSSVVTAHEEQRLAFSYVLCRLMDSETSRVAQAAARALGVLALRHVHPPPVLAAEQPPPPAKTSAAVDPDRLADEVVSVYSLPQEHRKPVSTMITALLANATG